MMLFIFIFICGGKGGSVVIFVSVYFLLVFCVFCWLCLAIVLELCITLGAVSIFECVRFKHYPLFFMVTRLTLSAPPC